MKTIVFFDPLSRAMSSSVLHSQLFGQMKTLAEMGLRCHFYGADRPEAIDKAGLAKLQEQYSMASIKITPVPGVGTSWRVAKKCIAACQKILMSDLPKMKPDFSFAWHALPALSLLRIPVESRGKLVYECQGASYAEVNNKGGHLAFLKSILIKHREEKTYRRVDRLIAVSQGMKKWLEIFVDRYDIFVIPCCFDESKFRVMPEERIKKRNQLGWPDDCPVIAYSGGMSYWQRLPEMFPLLSLVQKKILSLHVLLLSSTPDQMKALAVHSGLEEDKLAVRRVPHAEVPHWLNAADAGIVLRHDILVNQVASPIKIAEYMACGLSIIASPCIGDYSERIAKNGLGIILNESLDQNKIIKFLQNASALQECKKRAASFSPNYSWKSAENVYRQLYEVD